MNTEVNDPEQIEFCLAQGWSLRQIKLARIATGYFLSTYYKGRGSADNTPKPLADEARQTVEERLADGWAISECVRSGLLTWKMVEKHFQGRGWSSSEGGTHARMKQHMKVSGI